MSNYTPILGDIYTRKNGKKYEIREHDKVAGMSDSKNVCKDFKGNSCAFLDRHRCEKMRCLEVVYIRRKDLEQ